MLSRLFVLAALFVATAVHAQTRPDALLTIDQNRVTVIDRIMRDTGDAVARTQGWDDAQMREMLSGLRADHLLAASLAGTPEGLRDVVAAAMVRGAAPVVSGKVQVKAVGDVADDVAYTPVTPCRLVETRGTFAAVYQGDLSASHNPHPFAPNEVRDYVVQGGNNVCLSQLPQLPPGLGAAAVQLQVFAMPTTAASGDVEILPQGSTFGSTATMVYVGSIAFNTVSTNAKINTVNNKISVQVTGGGANVAIDVVGYFKTPNNYGGGGTISGRNATVSGGILNNATNENATVGGGNSNFATGIASTVPGGFFNVASGVTSFAAGNQATAAGDGSFVWADSTQVEFDATNGPHGWGAGSKNTFSVRATGGVWFLTGVDGSGNPLPGAGVEVLSNAGAWSTFSDRNGKDDIARVDPRAVLRKLVAMPVATWRWKGEDPQLRHMGPMAQDFYAAFGLGADDRHIVTVDADGVALAAIQGLNAKLEGQERELRKLRAEIGRLKKTAQLQ